ncbi:hypothetical protein [Halovenus sp. HT40]|uniref:hypothetical protein n=1 Tax=Halovenus sp. HT40 TaxID=3126691 RepID=UPI00300E78AB
MTLPFHATTGESLRKQYVSQFHSHDTANAPFDATGVLRTGRLLSRLTGTTQTIQSHEITPAIEDAVKETRAITHKGAEPMLFKVRPYKYAQTPIHSGKVVWEQGFADMFRTYLKFVNVSPIFSFEIWLHESTVDVRIFAWNKRGEEYSAKKVVNSISSRYPNAEIEQVWPSRWHEQKPQSGLLPLFTTGNIATTTKFRAKRPRYHAYRAVDERAAGDRDVEGVQTTREYIDPMGELLSELNIENDSLAAVVQLTALPVGSNWADKRRWAVYPRKKTLDQAIETYNEREKDRKRDSTSDEQDYADEIKNRADEDGFATNLRLYVAGDRTGRTPATARQVESLSERLAQKLKGMFEAEQKLRKVAPTRTRMVKKLFSRTASRDLTGDLWMPSNEVAVLGHLPNQQVACDNMDWIAEQAAEGVPQAAPRFDDSVGELYPIRAAPRSDSPSVADLDDYDAKDEDRRAVAAASDFDPKVESDHPWYPSDN